MRTTNNALFLMVLAVSFLTYGCGKAPEEETKNNAPIVTQQQKMSPPLVNLKGTTNDVSFDLSSASLNTPLWIDFWTSKTYLCYVKILVVQQNDIFSLNISGGVNNCDYLNGFYDLSAYGDKIKMTPNNSQNNLGSIVLEVIK